MDAREAGSFFSADIFLVLTAIDYIHCPKKFKSSNISDRESGTCGRHSGEKDVF